MSTPVYAMQHDDGCTVNFWHENKNSTNWCVMQSYGIPRKTANLTIFTLYLLLKVLSL